MEKNKVTKEEVQANMQDVIVRTVMEFGKPCTYVTVRMKNGFTLRESTTCVDPANYDENICKETCLKRIEENIWFLLGYALQEKIHCEKANEDIVMVELFHCQEGDGIGIHVLVDDTNHHFTCDNHGQLVQPNVSSAITYTSTVDLSPVSGHRDMVVGKTYVLTIDGRSYIAKLKDTDFLFYIFLAVDAESGSIELYGIPMDEMSNMIEAGLVSIITLK